MTERSTTCLVSESPSSTRSRPTPAREIEANAGMALYLDTTQCERRAESLGVVARTCLRPSSRAIARLLFKVLAFFLPGLIPQVVIKRFGDAVLG